MALSENPVHCDLGPDACFGCKAVKQCRRCGAVKCASAFGRKAQSGDGYQYWCKACINENNRQWRISNPERERERGRRSTCSKFRLTPDDYEAMLVDQGFGCAICGAPEGPSAMHIDHDHACCDFSPRSGANPTCGECTRGLLCSACNLLLGAARDDVDVLVGAIRYLETRRGV